jgi:hypothetical protein
MPPVSNLTTAQQLAMDCDKDVTSTAKTAGIAQWEHVAHVYRMKHGDAPPFEADQELYRALGYKSFDAYRKAKNLAGKTWMNYWLKNHQYYIHWLELTPETVINQAGNILADVPAEKLWIMRHLIDETNVINWLNTALELSEGDLAFVADELLRGTGTHQENDDQGFVRHYEEKCQTYDLIEVVHRIHKKLPPGATVKISFEVLSLRELTAGVDNG